MSRKTVRREAFGGDEADQQQPPKRPAPGQKRGSPAEEAVARLILTFGPLIIERFLMPPPPAPAPAPRVPGYFDGYQHCIDEARYVVRTECQSCTCALCRKVMSDDEPLDPRLGERPRPRSGS